MSLKCNDVECPMNLNKECQADEDFCGRIVKASDKINDFLHELFCGRADQENEVSDADSN